MRFLPGLFFSLVLCANGFAQTAAEMSSSSFAMKQSSFIGAGGTVKSQSFVLQQQFSSPNLGRMEGGQFVIGTAVEFFVDEHDGSQPTDYSLSQNFPNPFNQSTTFRYSLPQKSDVEISVYTVLGQQITVLLHGEQEAGHFTFRYNGGDGFQPLPSGVYFCRMMTKEFDKTIKFIILR